MIKYMGRGQTHKHTNTQTCRQINIMTRTGLRAGPSENWEYDFPLSSYLKPYVEYIISYIEKESTVLLLLLLLLFIYPYVHIL